MKTMVLIVCAVGFGLLAGSTVQEVGNTQEVYKKSLEERVTMLAYENPPVGTIVPYAGKDISSECWRLCNGDEVSSEEYPELAEVLIPTDGKIILPDLCGRTIVGAGQDKKGMLTNRPLFGDGGLENVTLTIEEMPSHSHKITDPGHHHNIKFGLAEHGDEVHIPFRNGDSSEHKTESAKTNIKINNSGGGSPHENMPPYLALNYIIKVKPSFPK